jgi:hypothetical protein
MARGRRLTNKLKCLLLSRKGCFKTWSNRMKSCKGWLGSGGIVSNNLLIFEKAVWMWNQDDSTPEDPYETETVRILSITWNLHGKLPSTD